MHFWDTGWCGFYSMMDRSFSFFSFLTLVSLALYSYCIKGKLTERESLIQNEKKISASTEVILFHHSANKQ